MNTSWQKRVKIFLTKTVTNMYSLLIPSSKICDDQSQKTGTAGFRKLPYLRFRYYVPRLPACVCFRDNVKDNINCFGICSGPPVCRKLRFLDSRGQGNPPAAPKGEEGVAVSGDEAESVGLEPALLLPFSSCLLPLSNWPPSPSLSPQSSASPSQSVAAATVVGATAAGTAEGVEVLLSTTWDLPPSRKRTRPWFCETGTLIYMYGSNFYDLYLKWSN